MVVNGLDFFIGNQRIVGVGGCAGIGRLYQSHKVVVRFQDDVGWVALNNMFCVLFQDLWELGWDNYGFLVILDHLDFGLGGLTREEIKIGAIRSKLLISNLLKM